MDTGLAFLERQQRVRDAGALAYRKGVPREKCPYVGAHYACCWREGWDEAQHEEFGVPPEDD